MSPADISYLWPRLVLIIACAGISAFFSGSETALFNLSRDELERNKSKLRSARLSLKLLESPHQLLTTILFGNMVVNITFYSVSYLLIVQFHSYFPAGLSPLLSVATLFFLIFFCEMLPKNIAVLASRPWSRFASYPLFIFQKVCWPIIAALERFTSLFSHAISNHVKHEPFLREEELQMMINLSEKEGIVEEDIGEMIAEIMELSDIPLHEIMVPRVQMVCFDIADPPHRLSELFAESKHTLIPVYEGRIDNILGFIHAKDFLFRDESKPLKELIRPASFLPESATVEDALRQMRKGHSRMAFVVDEYGAVEGLVTMEDILEEIVGEIKDEYDVDQAPPVQQIDNTTFRLRGNLSIREWRDIFQLEEVEISADTIGGLIMTLLDRMPREDDRIRYGNLEFTVEKLRRRRVETVTLKLLDDSAASGGDE